MVVKRARRGACEPISSLGPVRCISSPHSVTRNLRAIRRTKKPLIFIVLHGGGNALALALGKLDRPLRNHAAQRYAPDLGPALSEFDCGRVEFGVGVLTPAFDDLPDEIAGNE